MRSFDSIFVGAVIDHDVPATKIVKWRRRCGRPFQRSSLPRILWCGRTLEPAINQVVEKDQLRRTSNKCRDADELVQRQQRLQVIVYEGGITANVSGKTQKMKRHEDTVDTDERDPEMYFAQSVIHHAAGHFWEPEIGPGENAEDRRNPHDHVEMADDKISSVKIDVQ